MFFQKFFQLILPINATISIPPYTRRVNDVLNDQAIFDIIFFPVQIIRMERFAAEKNDKIRLQLLNHTRR